MIQSPVLLIILKSNEDADKTTKRQPLITREPDVGCPHIRTETVNDLAKSLQKTNDLLSLELENSYKYTEEKFDLVEEHFQLKIKLRVLEVFRARKQVSPTLQRHDTFLSDSFENNGIEENTMKQLKKNRFSSRAPWKRKSRKQGMKVQQNVVH